MATKLARRTLVLPAEMDAVLQRVKAVTGQSVSSLVVELLQPGMPALGRMVEAFEAIKVSHRQELAQFKADVERAEAVLEPLAVQALSTWNELAASAERSAKASVSPPSTNRGGISTTSSLGRGCKGGQSDEV